MLVDILSQDNYLSYNIKTAQLFGLNTAVYLAELINIYNKAKSKDKLLGNNHFKLDRKYVFVRTTLTVEEQLRIDEKMLKIGILSRYQETSDILKIDFKLYASIIASQDVDLLEDLAKRFGVVSKKDVKESKRQTIIRALKDSIVMSNYELLTALREWVDAIFSAPKGGYLSNASIKIFVDTLNEYTKGDLELALRLVKIATVSGYRDCTWAINVYEKDVKLKKAADSKLPRVTEQKRATKATLGDEIY